MSAPGGPEAAGRQLHPELVGELSGPIEALLLMADEPLPALTLAQLLQVPVETVEQALAELVDFYDRTGRGFELRQLAGGWRYWTRPEHAEVITRAVLEGQQSRLSQAALETLAVISYLQPITRARVSAVRGVNVDGVVRTLLAREMIAEAGHDPVSGAALFATTDTFLERIGLDSLEQLPELAPHLPEASELEAELSQLVTDPREPVHGQGSRQRAPEEQAADAADQLPPEPPAQQHTAAPGAPAPEDPAPEPAAPEPAAPHQPEETP